MKISNRLALCLLLVSMIQPVGAKTLDPEIGLKFQSDTHDWLMDEYFFNEYGKLSQTGDPRAIEVLAGLFAARDPRATTALQNYIKRYPNDPAAFDIAGTDLLRQQNYPVAATALRRALELAPDNPWVRAKLGTAQILSNQVNAGVRSLRKTLEDDPENPLALRYLAWHAVSQGDLGQAIIYSQRALRAFGIPKDLVNRAHLDLAELYRRSGQHDRLLALLSPAANNAGLNAPPHTQMQLHGLYFEAALRTRDAEKARHAFDRLSAISNSQDPQFRVAEARLLVAEGRPEDAIEILESVREISAEWSQAALPDLALAEARAGKVDAAVGRLAALAEVRGPDAGLPLYREAVGILFAEDRPADAVNLIRDAASAAPDRPNLQHLLTEAYIRAGQTDEALAEGRALVNRLPDDGQAHYVAALAAEGSGERDEALGYLRRAIEIDPSDARSWLTLVGLIHGHETYSHDHGGEASHGTVRALLNEALEAAPDNPDLWYELGLLTLSEGKPEEAAGVFREALTRAPAHLPNVTLAALSLTDARTDLDAAGQYLGIAEALQSGNPVILDIQGWHDLATGQTGPAIDKLERALQAAPEDATIMYHLAVAREAAGENDAALAHYLDALAGDLYTHYDRDARAALGRLNPVDTIEATVHRIDGEGVHEALGTLTVGATQTGVRFEGRLTGLPEGVNAAHIHTRPTCAPAMGPDGPVTGGLAGPHFGHGEQMAMADGVTSSSDTVDHAHMGHGATGLPRGDLPGIPTDASGVGTVDIASDQLTLAELRGRSLMIHLGPDEDGKSGPKIACAILR